MRFNSRRRKRDVFADFGMELSRLALQIRRVLHQRVLITGRGHFRQKQVHTFMRTTLLVPKRRVADSAGTLGCRWLTRYLVVTLSRPVDYGDREMQRAILLPLLLFGFVVVSGCHPDPVSPVTSAAKWKWGEPAGTGGGGGGCGDSNLLPSGALSSQSSRPLLDCEEGHDVDIVCDPGTVDVGETMYCDLDITPSVWYSLQVVLWEFDGPGIHAEKAGGLAWSGPMVIGGTITAHVIIDGQNYFPLTFVDVSRRNWSWSSSVTSGHAVGNELDDCFYKPTDEGTTSGLSCSSSLQYALFTPATVAQNGGYSATSVPGSGPNGGFWYIVSASARADIRAQLNSEWRSDGPAHSMTGDTLIVNSCQRAFPTASALNRLTVNTLCDVTSPGFVLLHAFAWAHEDRHVSAAVNAATQSANDVHALWEPLAAASESDLRQIASFNYTLSHVNVQQSANDQAVHTGIPYTKQAFWWNSSSGWWPQNISIID